MGETIKWHCGQNYSSWHFLTVDQDLKYSLSKNHKSSTIRTTLPWKSKGLQLHQLKMEATSAGLMHKDASCDELEADGVVVNRKHTKGKHAQIHTKTPIKFEFHMKRQVLPGAIFDNAACMWFNSSLSQNCRLLSSEKKHHKARIGSPNHLCNIA